MAKTTKIQIYLRDIIEEFGSVYESRQNNSFRTMTVSFKRGGKFLVAGMPDGETVFSSLN